jgi:hypothetical protein
MTLLQIKTEVESKLGLDMTEKKSATGKVRQTRAHVNARKIYCLLAKKYTTESLENIGQLIEHDHSTVVYSIHEGTIHLETDKDFLRSYTECDMVVQPYSVEAIKRKLKDIQEWLKNNQDHPEYPFVNAEYNSHAHSNNI